MNEYKGRGEGRGEKWRRGNKVDKLEGNRHGARVEGWGD